MTYGNFRRSFDDGMVEMERLTQRLLRLSYLEQQYETDYADTLILMDQVGKQSGRYTVFKRSDVPRFQIEAQRAFKEGR